MNDLVSRSLLDAPGCLGWPAQERLSERDRPRAFVYDFEPVIHKMPTEIGETKRNKQCARGKYSSWSIYYTVKILENNVLGRKRLHCDEIKGSRYVLNSFCVFHKTNAIISFRLLL